MKFYRILALVLTFAFVLSVPAMATGSLQWSFIEEEDDIIEFSNDDFVLISGGNCNVRDLPSLSGDILGTMKNGQTADCLGGQSVDNRGVVWYEIDYKGMSGWVSSKYAYLNGVNAVSYVTITGGQCHMRLEPNLSGEVIEILEEGSQAAYHGEVSTDDRGVDWYYVNYDGEEGWVSSRYAKFGSVSTSASYGYVKATSHKVNLRDEPNLDGEDIGTMDEGETAAYLGKKSTDNRGVVWYKVRFNGKEGWISSRYSKLYN